MKRSSTKAERDYMRRVSEIGCILCRHLGLGETPACVHHARSIHGWGRSSHYDTIPLCFEHHVGKNGVHDMGRDQFARLYRVSEVELLALTKLLLNFRD